MAEGMEEYGESATGLAGGCAGGGWAERSTGGAEAESRQSALLPKCRSASSPRSSDSDSLLMSDLSLLLLLWKKCETRKKSLCILYLYFFSSL